MDCIIDLIFEKTWLNYVNIPSEKEWNGAEIKQSLMSSGYLQALTAHGNLMLQSTLNRNLSFRKAPFNRPNLNMHTSEKWPFFSKC